jgi:Protein of unknown function (DUF1698)
MSTFGTEADIAALTKMQWYYSVELAPGVMTAGQDHPGGALTRNILRRVGFAGRDCIDIGIQEGLFSVLLYRGRARSVEGLDRFPRTIQVNALRRIYETPFNFSVGQSLDTYIRMRQQGGRLPADVVLFSGVLYHMFDPFAGLCRVRALVLERGIVIVETAVVLRASTPHPALFFNADNKLHPGSTYFIPNPSWLDEALRFVGLVPLDCIFLHYEGTSLAGRICIPCRAGSLPELGNPDRKDWERDFIARDFSEFIDLEKLRYATEPVEYDVAAVTAVRRADGSVDVAKTVAAGQPLSTTRRDVTLMLADRD